jgi:hypothetical protein
VATDAPELAKRQERLEEAQRKLDELLQAWVELGG